MAMPFYEHARAALAAELHVQIEIERVVLPGVTPGAAKVHGRIARVFRGDPALRASPIHIQVDCFREGDSDLPVGVTWTPVEELLRAGAVEAYLDRSAEGYEVALENFRLLARVTDTPEFVITEEDAREPVRPPASRVKDFLVLAGARLAFAAFLGLGLAGFGYAIWALLR
jgi:hypothetical protein